MSVFRYPQVQTTITGGATEAKQDLIITELQDVNTELDAQSTTLTSLDGKDFATQTTLAALDAKVTAVDTTDKSTATKQDAQTALLTTIDADTSTLASTDFATQTTSAAILAELALKADLTETQPVSAASLPLPVGASTESKQDSTITELQSANTSLDNIEADIDALNTRLAASLVPDAHDYLAVTYVAAGNGIGEISTVTYKTGGSGGTTVATLTLTYDASNRLASVTKA